MTDDKQIVTDAIVELVTGLVCKNPLVVGSGATTTGITVTPIGLFLVEIKFQTDGAVAVRATKI